MIPDPPAPAARGPAFPARVLAAAGCGAVSVLGWAPWEAWGVLPIAYGGLYACFRRCRRAREVAALAAAFALAQHAAGHGWLLAAIVDHTGPAFLPAGIGVAVLLLYLCAFVALPAFGWARMFSDRDGRLGLGRHPLREAFGLAACLTLGEWMRSRAYNGFTSLSVGYACLDTPLEGHAPVFGMYGVGFAAYAVMFLLPRIVRNEGGRWRPDPKAAAWAGAFVIVGGAGQAFAWVEEAGDPVGFRLIQTRVRQQHKFDPAFVLQEIARLKEEIVREAADLVATPETAFPLFFHELPGATLDELRRFSTEGASSLLLGIARMGADGSGYNSVLHVAPGQRRFEFYDKVRLMPFGEYGPRGFDWLTRRLQIPLKDLTAGEPAQRPFDVRGVGIGVMICHEDLVGAPNRHWAASAGVLLNPSNMAWFEHGLAIPQRLQIVRMRALEMGRPVLRVTNAGITAHIDHRGRVRAQLPVGEAGVLAGAVRPMRGMTPFSWFGDWPVVFGLLGIVAFAGFRPKLGARPPRPQEAASP